MVDTSGEFRATLGNVIIKATSELMRPPHRLIKFPANRTTKLPPKFQDVFGYPSRVGRAERQYQVPPSTPTGSSMKIMMEAFPDRADVGVQSSMPWCWLRNGDTRAGTSYLFLLYSAPGSNLAMCYKTTCYFFAWPRWIAGWSGARKPTKDTTFVT
jgi:hypothetical protein